MASRPRSVRGLALLAVIVMLGAAGCDVGTGQAAPEANEQAASSTPTPAAAGSAPAAPATPAPASTPAPTSKPAAPTPSTPKPAAVLSRGDQGEKVRELQHRLRQLEWFAGNMTGTYADSTVKAVKGYQGKRKFDETGAVDKQTWNSLVDRTRTPTRAERHNELVAGPAIMKQGSSGDRVRELQARLKQIAWYSPNVTGNYGGVTVASVRGFQGKRAIPVTGEVDQRTWDRLSAMTRTPTSDAKHNRVPKASAPRGLDPRCLTGRVMCISKRNNSLVWVIDGQAQLRFDVRFGSAELPTRSGTFSVGWKSRNHVSSLYHTKMPYAMFFSGGQAVHYSPDFAARGYSGASHGCVNVRNLSGIQSLFSQARVGDKVIIYS